MTQNIPRAAQPVAAALEHAPIAAYVSTADHRTLLYANALARTLFFASGAGQDGPFVPPCAQPEGTACTDHTFFHAPSGRTYRCSGQAVDWDGQAACLTYLLETGAQGPCREGAGLLHAELLETFSRLPVGLAVYRFAQGQFSPLFHNPAFYTILGYSDAHIADIRRQTRFLGVHPDDRQALEDKVRALMQDGGGVLQHTFRIFNDRAQAYRWIRLEASGQQQTDGSCLLYGVYSDINERMRLEQELASANSKMEDIINAIPGGVAIYKVTDIFETVYFSDGVPALSGYTTEEYRELVKQDASEMTYYEDTPMVVARAKEVIRTHEVADFEFRKQHRDGHIVWVRVQIKWIGEEDGYPLLHCVFHNISDLKEAQLEMQHLVNSIPGGIASYRIEGARFIPTYFSDGVLALSGHTRAEFEEMAHGDAANVIYEPDRPRVMAAAQAAISSGEVLDVSYRMRHKRGHLIWIHLNGRRMGPISESIRFYAVFTGISEETRLYQEIVNETADGVYIIDRNTYELLYVNESKKLFLQQPDCVGQKCYAALHGRQSPCPFCTLHTHTPETEHTMSVEGDDRFYTTRFRELEWNGIPAYIKYVRDVTEEITTRREKERLEQYFQTVLKYLPGGIAVIRRENDGSMTPEFLSEGFAALTGMTLEAAWTLYRTDAMAGVHPEDRAIVNTRMCEYIASGESQCEIVYRLRRGDGGYVWVKNTLSLIQSAQGESRVYAVYQDMTQQRAEQARTRRRYQELIIQHYRSPDPNALIIGHCNVTQNRILEIIDRTDSDLLHTFGAVRQTFFTGLSSLIVDPDERQTFLGTYLNEPALAAFRSGETEQVLRCFVHLPHDPVGRYVQFQVNLVEMPDTGDIAGILTVTDVTAQTISDRILHQLSVTGYDFVIDLDLDHDRYRILSAGKNAGSIPHEGSHSGRILNMTRAAIVPRDRARYREALDPEKMRRRLAREGLYTFAFSILEENGDVRTKNMTVSAIDLRIGRICLLRTDITESVHEQQGLLNMLAYTFELMGFIDVRTRRLTMYTHETMLQNLSPYVIEDYENALERFTGVYRAEPGGADPQEQFALDCMLRRLAEKPEGYDFVLPYDSAETPRYKQINVLWGDQNHRTICLVRADVTDMLVAERRSKAKLQEALSLAEEASRAKSDFLSTMSHDIRTPMNAIMGMTALATAHLDDRARVADCLQKITSSSRHLLSLINDVLDMSKIEGAKIELGRMRLCLPDLLEQLSTMLTPQANAAQLQFVVRAERIVHPYFYGDGLRINQILINLLSNAIKFTQAGGAAGLLVEEIAPVDHPDWARYRFTIRDTGMGMSESFLTRLFEPFSRSRTAARIEGTGLGLSITKGLVDLMHGTIHVQSTEGAGTAFCVELECEPAPVTVSRCAGNARDEAARAETEAFLSGRRFLVAEDNAINAEILCEILQMQGARTVVRADGAQAVAAFRDAAPGTYDAILMDVQMPEMNGYEATRAIRALHRPDASVIPIVAMTANAFAEDVQASRDAGMTAHIAKPIDFDVLRATLYRVLRGLEER